MFIETIMPKLTYDPGRGRIACMYEVFYKHINPPGLKYIFR